MSEPQHSPQDETFMHLFTKHEGKVRAFVTSLLPRWEGVDEVMQETSLVMWRKFDQFDTSGPEQSFLNWSFMIARYEVLKYRRKRATDRLVFSEDVFELLAVESEEVASEHTDRERALRSCLRKLEPAQQGVVNQVYAEGISIKNVADQIGRTPTGLYKSLARIRRNLHRCIGLTLSEGRLRESL